jgi:hypothetical protein
MYLIDVLEAIWDERRLIGQFLVHMVKTMLFMALIIAALIVIATGGLDK